MVGACTLSISIPIPGPVSACTIYCLSWIGTTGHLIASQDPYSPYSEVLRRVCRRMPQLLPLDLGSSSFHFASDAEQYRTCQLLLIQYGL